MQNAFLSLLLGLLAITLGVGFALYSDRPLVVVMLCCGAGVFVLGTTVWVVGWCLPGMFSEWRRMAVPKGHCPECDFDLTGLDPTTTRECPECGRVLAASEVVAPPAAKAETDAAKEAEAAKEPAAAGAAGADSR